MSRFVRTDTVRVELGDGDWVEIHRALNYGDRVDIQKKLLSVRSLQDVIRLQRLSKQLEAAKPGDPAPEMPELNLRDSNVELLTRAIAAWGGPGFCSQEEPHAGEHTPRPVTFENIAGLDESADEILAAVKNVLVTKTEGFSKPASPPLSTAEQAASTENGSTSLKSSAAPGGPGSSSD